MLNFSFAELSLVAIIAILLLGTEDIITIIKGFKRLRKKIKSYLDEHFSEFNDLINTDEVENLMVDEDGKLQKMYDNSKIASLTKDLKKTKTNAKNAKK